MVLNLIFWSHFIVSLFQMRISMVSHSGAFVKALFISAFDILPLIFRLIPSYSALSYSALPYSVLFHLIPSYSVLPLSVKTAGLLGLWRQKAIPISFPQISKMEKTAAAAPQQRSLYRSLMTKKYTGMILCKNNHSCIFRKSIVLSSRIPQPYPDIFSESPWPLHLVQTARTLFQDCPESPAKDSSGQTGKRRYLLSRYACGVG